MSLFGRKFENELQWTVRVSKRSRYARLQIKPFGGLEVVIPRNFPRYQIRMFVEQHREWIEKKLQEQQHKHQSIQLPTTLHLELDGSSTPVVYTTPAVNADSGVIRIRSNELPKQIQELRDWIRKRAWLLLPPMLDQISQTIGIDYRKLTIRSQKTRWGSCSSNGTISLNDQLLFVDRQTVEYLIIHELCHRRVMNHSAGFWALVESFCIDYQQREQALDQARHKVPGWFMAGLYL